MPRISSQHKSVVGCAAAGIGLFLASAAPAALNYRTVALTGTDGTYGPGQAAGVTFASLVNRFPVVTRGAGRAGRAS
jgi:hypothetical protein